MDALALLCNLHADGPATLQRLRRIGCESIDGVAGLTDELLGRELRQSEPGARRFKREAHNLQVRMVGGTPLPEPEAEAEAQVELIPKPKLPGMSHVLEAWRQIDEESPPEQPSVFGEPDLSKQADAPGEPAPAEGLSSAEVDGLTPEVLLRLHALGIRSVDALVEAASLTLAQDLPMPLTRVKRLQMLARRVRTRQALREDSRPEQDLLPAPLQVPCPEAQAFGTLVPYAKPAVPPKVESEAPGTPEFGAELLPVLPAEKTMAERELPQPERITSDAGGPAQERAEDYYQDEGFGLPAAEELSPGDPEPAEEPDTGRFESGGPFA